MEKVIDKLYKISDEMHTLLNGCGRFNEELFCARGKLFNNENDAEQYFNPNPRPVVFESHDENGNVIGGWRIQSENECDNVFENVDCRFDSVDKEVKQHIYDSICKDIIDFYNEAYSEDEFLLFFGFSINLYYIVGLYSTYGKFDESRVLKDIDSGDVKEYGRLINDFLHTKMTKGILECIRNVKKNNGDLFYETLTKIMKHESTDINSLSRCVRECDRRYIPEIYKAIMEYDDHFDSEEDFSVLERRILKRMTSEYPMYRFGFVYICLEKGLDFYNSKGKKIDVVEYKEKLGSDLFAHTIGIKDLGSVEFEWVNGKIEKRKNALFSVFGLGLPQIIPRNRIDFFENNIAPMLSEEDEEKKVSFSEIREETENILGVKTVVYADNNVLQYVGKLFDVVERQRMELEINNKKLEKHNEQRGKMMDHLAHSWGNECYPEIVKSVADELLKSGDKSLANKLFKAYHSEKNLMGEIIFVQAAIDDESETLKEVFRDSFYISCKGKDEWKIKAVIEEALENLFFGLINTNNDDEKRNICRKKLCCKHSLTELADLYARRFDGNDEERAESFLKWFEKNIFPIEIVLDEVWNNINFGNTEYGKIVIKNIFTELFTNVLFHGDTNCRINLTSSGDRMYIKVANGISEEKIGRMKGLSSMKEVVAKLNINTVVSEEEGISHGINVKGEYETIVTLAKDLMFIEED